MQVHAGLGMPAYDMWNSETNTHQTAGFFNWGLIDEKWDSVTRVSPAVILL